MGAEFFRSEGQTGGDYRHNEANSRFSENVAQ
jgi:hypothetical protein